ALANRAELPLAAIAVQLTEHHRGLSACIFSQVETDDFYVGLGVDQANESVRYLPEVLAALISVVTGDCDDDLVDVSCNLAQVYQQGLVVAVAFAGTVVTGVLNGAVDGAHLVVEDEVGIGTNFAIGGQQERGSVEVKVLAISRACIPTQTNEDLVQTRIGFGQRQVPTFLK